MSRMLYEYEQKDALSMREQQLAALRRLVDRLPTEAAYFLEEEMKGQLRRLVRKYPAETAQMLAAHGEQTA